MVGGAGIDAAAHFQLCSEGADPAAPHGFEPVPLEENWEAGMLSMQRIPVQQARFGQLFSRGELGEIHPST